MNVWQIVKQITIDATASHGTALGGALGIIGAVDNFITGHYSTLMFIVAALGVWSGHMAAKNKLAFKKEQAAKKKKVKS